LLSGEGTLVGLVTVHILCFMAVLACSGFDDQKVVWSSALLASEIFIALDTVIGALGGLDHVHVDILVLAGLTVDDAESCSGQSEIWIASDAVGSERSRALVA